MRGCRRRTKHLQLLSEANNYLPPDLLSVGVRFPEHTESEGGSGKNDRINTSIFPKMCYHDNAD